MITRSSSLISGMTGIQARTSCVRYQASEHALFQRFKGRAFAVGVSVLVVVLGMAYTLFWGPLVRHTSVWVTPGDFWATYGLPITWGGATWAGSTQPTRDSSPSRESLSFSHRWRC